MKAVVQRVSWARVLIDGALVGSCGPGFLVLAAAGREDTAENAKKMADRIMGMRVFPDSDGKMNLNLASFESSLRTLPEKPNILAVSNFTVYGDASQRRPSFGLAAPYEAGEVLFEQFVEELRSLGARVETGVFGADMQVELANDGPVTLVVDA
jgi:D-tyrosyl-tRNA(Tyr) deacylase